MKTPIHLNGLKSMVEKSEQFSIYCHPDNLRFLKEISQEVYPEKENNKKYNFYNSFGDWFPPLHGLEIFTDSNLDRCAKHWEFPVRPTHWTGNFWEYRKEDEEWAIPIGHGKWVDGDPGDPIFYIIRNPSLLSLQFMYSFPTIDKRKFILTA